MKKYFIILLFLLSHMAVFSNTVFFKIASVEISGSQKTKQNYIINESGLEKGSVLRINDIQTAAENAENNLKSTNNFSDVSVNYTLKKDQAFFEIVVSEKWSLFPYIVPFYSSSSGLSIVSGLIETNFLGLHKLLITSLKYAGDERQFFIKFIDNSLFSTGSILEAEFEYSREKEFYDTENYEWMELLRYEGEYLYPLINNLYTGFYFENSFSLNNIRKPNPSVIFTPSLLYSNLRSNKYFKNGHEFRLRPGIMNSIQPYPEFYLYAEELMYFNLSDNNRPDNSYFAVRAAVINSPGRSFSLNTSDNIRGITEGEIRGKSGFTANTEYRHFLAGLNKPFPLYIFIPVYFDAGFLTDSIEKSDLSETRYTCGSGIIFYPEKVDVLLRLNIGMNISSYQEDNSSFSFFSVSIGREMF